MGECAESVPVTFVSSHAGSGGSEAYLRRLVQRLGPDWVAGVVVLQDGPLVDALVEDGVEPRVVAIGPRPADVLSCAPTVRSAVGALPGRVLHANGVKAAIVSAIALPKYPLVWLKHDHSFDGWRARLLARRCHQVIGVSHSVLRTLHGFGRTRVVYNGIDCHPADVAEGLSAVHQSLGRKPVHTVALVGRLDPAKGHFDLLEAVALACKSGRNVDVLIVGGHDPAHPGHVDRIFALASRLGIKERVHVLGHRDDVSTLIAGCDVVAIPSHAVTASGVGQEGFGLVALEAMCAGTPVVAYAGGAVSEVVADCGAFVAPRDVEALGQALQRVWSNADERSRMSDCGRKRAKTFSFDRTVEELRRHYREAAR